MIKLSTSPIKLITLFLLVFAFVAAPGAKSFDLIKLTQKDSHAGQIVALQKLLNANIDVIKQVFEEEWNDNAWQPGMKITYEYKGDRFSQMLVEIYLDGQLARATKMVLTFDGAGDMVEMKVLNDSDGSGNFENSMLDHYTYSNHHMTNSLTQYWENDAWVNMLKAGYQYDGDNMIQELEQQWQDGSWVNERRTTRTYENDLATVNLIEVWENNAWSNLEKTLATYDANGNETESREQNWDGSQWVDMKVITWSYNAQGDVLQELSETSFVGITMKTRDTYTYDSQDSLSEQLTEQWDMGSQSWFNVRQRLFTYKDGALYQELDKKWDGSAFVNDKRDTYSYTTLTRVARKDENPKSVPQNFRLTNYPNPFNPETTIQFNLPQDAKISLAIYDAQGNRVTSLIDAGVFSAGLHSIQWDGTNQRGQSVASGAYFYRLQTNGYIRNGTCTLLR